MMTGVSVGFLGLVAVSFPLVGVLFAIIWSIMFDFEASVRTVCHVENWLPTVSSAIGGFTPQRYVWRICITMHAGLRFMLAFCYYNWHLRVSLGARQATYKLLVTTTVACHLGEIMALVVLTSISSTDNGEIHEYSFILFMVCSLVYMLLSCILIKWTHIASVFKVSQQDKTHLQYKVGLFVFNLSIFLTSVYLYFRHETYCEPNKKINTLANRVDLNSGETAPFGALSSVSPLFVCIENAQVYSWFALCEYLVIFSNIAFHGMCYVDFNDYSVTFLATEDLRSGAFKNR